MHTYLFLNLVLVVHRLQDSEKFRSIERRIPYKHHTIISQFVDYVHFDQLCSFDVGWLSIYSDTNTFSPPLSHLTRDGRPYLETASTTHSRTVPERLLSLAFRYTGSLEHSSIPPCITILQFSILSTYDNRLYATNYLAS